MENRGRGEQQAAAAARRHAPSNPAAVMAGRAGVPAQITRADHPGRAPRGGGPDVGVDNGPL